MTTKINFATVGMFVAIVATGWAQSNLPPKIVPANALHSQAANLGSAISFSINATGTAPLGFHWQFNGQDLPGQTNKTLTITDTSPADEGDYQVLVTNLAGSVSSELARLYVVPPAEQLIKGNFIGVTRLPYFYFVPTNYSAARSYPLVCMVHGGGGDKMSLTNGFPGWPGYGNIPAFKVFASFRQQMTDPAIVVWPTRTLGNDTWTTENFQEIINLLATFVSSFKIDTNRVYIAGFSDGFPAAWDIVGKRPGVFAGALLVAGQQGTSSATSISRLPLWAFCSVNDEFGSLDPTRSAVGALRMAGAATLYTEYSSGGHLSSLTTGFSTVPVVDWLLAQRLGVKSAVGPLVATTNHTHGQLYVTGSSTADLAGTASALGQPIAAVSWTNTVTRTGAQASGFESWSALKIPLQPEKTNIVIVTATTTSWAPGIGGNTTINDTLAILSTPIRETLSAQAGGLVLHWTGGVPPFRVQLATQLAPANWRDLLTNAAPPVPIAPDNPSGYYRVLGN